MALYIECEHLTDKEKQVRHDLIYLFNPCLKTIFNRSPKFMAYGYNSCRQTAVFSSVFLLEAFKKERYRIESFEGTFSDIISGQETEYEHAFSIATKEDRKLLIDVSRTERQLLFKTTHDIIYPTFFKGYENCKLLHYEKFDFTDRLLIDEPEYITGKKPIEVYIEAKEMYNWIKSKPKSEQLKFASQVYNNMTKIGGEFV